MRSSSSSAPELSFAHFLGRSLDALAEELPAIYAEMCRTLAPRAVRIALDGEVVTVACTPERATLLDVHGALDSLDAPAVDVRTSRAAIVALIDARSTLVESVVADRVELRGKLDDLVAFHDGLVVYLHGAVRAPSFPALLLLFRRSIGTGTIPAHA